MLQGASTVDELISMIPADYRQVLRKPLLVVADTATKLCHARSSLAKLDAHIVGGTLPSSLQSKAPSHQSGAEHAKSDAGRAAKDLLETKHREYQVSCLKSMQSFKRDEVTSFEESLSADKTFPVLLGALTPRFETLKKISKVVEYVQDTTAGATADTKVPKFLENPTVPILFEQVRDDLLGYLSRVRIIVESREDAVSTKKQAKKRIATDTDVEMGEIPSSSASIAEQVKYAVAAALK
ncbi:hypothetical protein BD779DRAFT_1452310, partial [Infundibulicybe gibba]